MAEIRVAFIFFSVYERERERVCVCVYVDVCVWICACVHECERRWCKYFFEFLKPLAGNTNLAQGLQFSQP